MSSRALTRLGHCTLLLAGILVGCDIDHTSKPLTDASIATASGSAVVNKSKNNAAINLNQVGFLPSSKKLAVVPAAESNSFSVVKADTNEVVFEGSLGSSAYWDVADENVRLADFSDVKEPGLYQIRVSGLSDSPVFGIATDEYKALNIAAIRYFYLNRASSALTPENAGAYARPAGHADTQVLVHASAASHQRPEGTLVSAPKGWYDAGDYNKYIVNSGISTYTLLAAYEHYPEYYKALALKIPESDDKVPDILNEAMWNLEWMLNMQDPNDGGVYHKLTNKTFDGFVMPDKANEPRYLVQKSTAAALDFAAVMAVASRVFREYGNAYPGMSAKMLAASRRAYEWAKANPDVLYQQPPDIKTGEYGDDNLTDEFAWAAVELYITTREDAYYQSANLSQLANAVPSYGDVRGLAWMSLAYHRSQLTQIADRQLIARRIDSLANDLLAQWQASAYAVPLQKNNFVWGSNSVAANTAMMLIQAYRLNGNSGYLEAAQSLLDYLLGRNATGYSFVTGFGHKTPKHPHHRISEADGVEAPVPGMLVGGPNPGQQDKSGCKAVSYPSNLPAKSYLDDVCSYASNEVAINWNAPLVYISGALQILIEQ